MKKQKFNTEIKIRRQSASGQISHMLCAYIRLLFGEELFPIESHALVEKYIDSLPDDFSKVKSVTWHADQVFKLFKDELVRHRQDFTFKTFAREGDALKAYESLKHFYASKGLQVKYLDKKNKLSKVTSFSSGPRIIFGPYTGDKWKVKVRI